MPQLHPQVQASTPSQTPSHSEPESDHSQSQSQEKSLATSTSTTGKVQATLTLKKLARRLNKLATALLDNKGQVSEKLGADEARQVSEKLEAVEKVLKKLKRASVAAANANANNPRSGQGQGQGRTKGRTEASTGTGVRATYRRVRVSGPIEVNSAELMILEWLREKKFATTGQVKSQLVIERATDRLRELEKEGLLSSYRYQAHKGRQSEKCYWLSYAGAKYLTERGLATRYESRYVSRPPSEYAIHFRTLELEVPFEARRLGWRVIEPKYYNSVHPRPRSEASQQARFLREILDRQQQREIERARRSGQGSQAALTLTKLVRDYEAHKHLQMVESQLNHHVCYLPQVDRAIIFILCPEDITGQFWETRLKEYGELARRIKTFGVFYTREQATAWLEPINESAIGVVSLEKLHQVLRDITYEYEYEYTQTGQD